MLDFIRAFVLMLLTEITKSRQRRGGPNVPYHAEQPE